MLAEIRIGPLPNRKTLDMSERKSLMILVLLVFAIPTGCDSSPGDDDESTENGSTSVARPSLESGTTFSSDNGLPKGRIYAVASCPDGSTWFGFGVNGSGMARLEGSSWTTFSEEDGLESNYVYALSCDSENNIWIGYGIQAGGVTVFDGSQWSTYTEDDGLTSNYVAAITTSENGELWIGYADQSEGVDRFR